MSQRIKNILKSDKIKYLLVIAIGLIALIMQIGIISSVVADQAFENDGCVSGLQFSESYNPTDQTYDVEVVVVSHFGVAEGVYAINSETGSKTELITEPGQSVVVEGLEEGEDIKLVGVFEDGSEQLFQSYTVQE